MHTDPEPNREGSAPILPPDDRSERPQLGLPRSSMSDEAAAAIIARLGVSPDTTILIVTVTGRGAWDGYHGRQYGIFVGWDWEADGEPPWPSQRVIDAGTGKTLATWKIPLQHVRRFGSPFIAERRWSDAIGERDIVIGPSRRDDDRQVLDAYRGLQIFGLPYDDPDVERHSEIRPRGRPGSSLKGRRLTAEQCWEWLDEMMTACAAEGGRPRLRDFADAIGVRSTTAAAARWKGATRVGWQTAISLRSEGII